MMIYNITSKEKALETLVELTSISKHQIQEFINEHVFFRDIEFNTTQLTAKNFIRKFSIDVKSIEVKDLCIFAIHYTSNNDNCKSIFDVGLRNLKYAVSMETPLYRFLTDNDIHINTEARTLRIGRNSWNIDYNKHVNNSNEEVSEISKKVYNDYSTSCFLFIENIEDNYISRVDLQPEILLNLDNLYPKLDLQSKWRSISKKYEITFVAPVSCFQFESLTEELISNALNIAGEAIVDFIQVNLRSNSIISQDMILGVIGL